MSTDIIVATSQQRQFKTTSESVDKSSFPKSQIRNPFRILRREGRQIKGYIKTGHWTERQKIKYAVFVEFYKKRFEVRAKRRFSNTFELMANFIKTRNSHQCRSHHQKMQKQKFRVDAILSHVESKYVPKMYQQLRENYFAEIEAMYDDQDSESFQNFKSKAEQIQEKRQQHSIQSQKDFAIALRSAEPIESISPNNREAQPLETLQSKQRERFEQSQQIDKSIANYAAEVKAEEPNMEPSMMTYSRNGSNFDYSRMSSSRPKQHMGQSILESTFAPQRSINAFNHELSRNNVLFDFDLRIRYEMKMAEVALNEHIRFFNRAKNVIEQKFDFMNRYQPGPRKY